MSEEAQERLVPLLAGVTFASTIIASVLVRQLARSWR